MSKYLIRVEGVRGFCLGCWGLNKGYRREGEEVKVMYFLFKILEEEEVEDRRIR